jgi:hypothetical protein
VLLPKDTWDGIVDGSITVAFRRWQRPTVRPGATLRTPAGVLGIDEVMPIGAEDVTDADAQRAGAADRAAALEPLERWDGQLYRIRFHRVGDDPRSELARQVPTGGDLDAVVAELAAIDRASRRGPWTVAVLQLIAARPDVPAGDLADDVGRDRAAFKRDVRRLKELGLTISRPVGYRLSPRGVAVLAAIEG